MTNLLIIALALLPIGILAFYINHKDKDRPEPTQDQALTNAAEILGDIGSAIE
jgi:hypothetical protein